MSLDSEIRARARAASQELLRRSAVELREAHTELQVYFSDNLQSPTAVNHKVGKDGVTLHAKRNTTDKLFMLYGNLLRALQPKQIGSISKVEQNRDFVLATIGIDTTATVTAGKKKVRLTYAAVHEFGSNARPYFYPAIQAYALEELESKARSAILHAQAIFNQ